MFKFKKKIAKKERSGVISCKTKNQVVYIYTRPLKFKDIRRLRARLEVQKIN